MMNYIFRIFLILLLISSCSIKDLKKQNTALADENAALKEKLKTCENANESFFYKLLNQSKEYPADFLTFNELKYGILGEIKKVSTNNYEKGKRVVALAEEFGNYIEDLRSKLIDETGGWDDEHKMPVGKRDKATTTKLLVDQGLGKELKEKISELHENFLAFTKEGFEEDQLVLVNQLEYPDGRYSKWEEFKFNNMPLAAVLPLLGYIKSQAEDDALTVLKYLIKPD